MDVGGQPHGVGDAGVADEAEQIANSSSRPFAAPLPPLATVSTPDLSAQFSHDQTDRHVAGDHPPRRR
jgi:hypothetical protein